MIPSESRLSSGIRSEIEAASHPHTIGLAAKTRSASEIASHSVSDLAFGLSTIPRRRRKKSAHYPPDGEADTAKAYPRLGYNNFLIQKIGTFPQTSI